MNNLYVPHLAKIFKNIENFGNEITGKENIIKYFEECDMVRKLQVDPNLIIQLFDDRPDIKEIAFNAFKRIWRCQMVQLFRHEQPSDSVGE